MFDTSAHAFILLHTLFVSHIRADSCANFTACEGCYAASDENWVNYCHWCPDNTCHTIGSPYGCLTGISCQPPEPGPACADFTDCDSCYSLMHCHWCGNTNGCFAIGDLEYGCLWGTSCYANSECQRKGPEFKGYVGAPLGLVFLVTFLFGLCCACGLGFLYVCSRFAKSVRKARESHLRILNAQAAAGVSSTYPSNVGSIHMVDVFVANSFRFILYFAIVLSVVFCLILGGLLFYFPNPPLVDSCSGEYDWKSLVAGIGSALENKQLEAQYEYLISIYNPTRLMLQIDSVAGQISYRGETLGTFSAHDLQTPPGSVADALVTLSMSVGVWESLNLSLDYWNDSLELLVNLTFIGTLNLWGYPLTQLPLWGIEIPVKPSNPVQAHGLCHCQLDEPPKMAKEKPRLQVPSAT